MSEQEREAFERNHPAPKNVEWSEELGRYKTKFLHGLPPTMGGIYQARWEGWQSRAQSDGTDIDDGTKSQSSLDFGAIHMILRKVWSRELSADDGLDEIESIVDGDHSEL